MGTDAPPSAVGNAKKGATPVDDPNPRLSAAP